MLIEKNKVVTFHYTLTETDNVVENSRDGEPLVFLHGHNGMLKGLEDQMLEKQKGDKLLITLSPDDAYGQRREDAQQRVSMKHVVNPSKKKIKYKAGMVVQINTSNGPREVVVIKAGLKNIDVDTNHPFAGKTLTFDIEILDVRDATTEELAHGHVHGAGGHQH